MGVGAIHPTSVAYIQDLVGPYAEALDVATDVDSIFTWLPQALGPIYSESIADSIGGAIDEYRGIMGDDASNAQLVEVAKEKVVFELSRTLILTGLFMAVPKDGSYILPWDIRDGIEQDDDLRDILGLREGDRLLPVEVIINGTSYTHRFSEEFTLGLLLYTLFTQNPYILRISGVVFTNEYFAPQRRNRLTEACSQSHTRRYSVQIPALAGGSQYCFDTPDFMQGFATGAMWYNDDHHNYWNSLVDYGLGPEGVPIYF